MNQPRLAVSGKSNTPSLRWDFFRDAAGSVPDTEDSCRQLSK